MIGRKASQLAAMQELAALLDDRLRLAPVRGETERAAAVQDRDRRCGRPLHPREVAARERVAADHDARVARFGRRAARDRRAAHRPDRARRARRGRVRPRAAIHTRVRLLRRADRARLGPRPPRTGLGEADGAPRLHPVRRAGRRRGLPGHRRDGPPGTRGADRHPHQPAHTGAGQRRSPERVTTLSGGTGRARRPRDVPCDRRRLLRGAGDAAGDDRLRPAGFTRRPGGVDARPRHGQLPEDRPRLRRRATRGQPHPRPHHRQRHPVLAHRHRGLGGPLVLGGRARNTLVRPARLPRRSRSRSASPRSRGRSGGPRGAGSRRPTPTPSTSTRWTRAVTSPRGKSRNSSQRRCAQRSGHCASRHS